MSVLHVHVYGHGVCSCPCCISMPHVYGPQTWMCLFCFALLLCFTLFPFCLAPETSSSVSHKSDKYCLLFRLVSLQSKMKIHHTFMSFIFTLLIFALQCFSVPLIFPLRFICCAYLCLFHIHFACQCCGAETIFFRSGSNFQKVSTPAPATALELPVFTDFMLKKTFFMFLMKENRPNSHARSYSI